MRRRCRGEEGTTLIELVVASAIALTILGSVMMTTAVIGGQATSIYHSGVAAGNAEQVLDHAATQLANAEQLGVCSTQNAAGPCPATSFPPTPVLAASANGLCFAAPITPTQAANTTPNSAPQVVCIVTGGVTVNRLYLDIYPSSASSYAACISWSCFTTSPQTCMGTLTQGSCSGSGVTSYYLGALSAADKTPFTYYNASVSPIVASGPFGSTELSDIRAVQLDVEISAGYAAGRVAKSYTLDYTAAVR